MFLLEDSSVPNAAKEVEAPKETVQEIEKENPISPPKDPVQHGEVWTLQVDGSSSGRLGGIGIYLKSPQGAELDYAVTLDFKVTNNEAEYEALLIGLRMARSLQVKKIKAYIDSQLVEAQFSGAFATKGPTMIKYQELLMKEVEQFEEFTLERFAREWNERADALARFASASGSIDTRGIILLIVRTSSVMSPTLNVLTLTAERSWMTNIFNYLKDGSLPLIRSQGSKKNSVPSKQILYT